MKKTRYLLMMIFLGIMSLFIPIKANAASTGLTFTYEDYYSSDKALEVIPLTYEAEIKVPTTVSNRPGILYSNYATYAYEDYYSFEIYYEDGVAFPRLYFEVNEKDNVNTAPVVFDFKDIEVRSGQYIHLAITLDNSNPSKSVAKCYLNGVLKQTIEKVAPAEYENFGYVPSLVGRLGSSYEEDNAQYFKGEIRSLTMYRDVRSAQEIQNGVNQKDSNLLAYYKLSNNDNGKNISNLAGDEYNLTYSSRWFDKEDAKDYAYSFAVIGDTQSLCELHTEHMNTMYNWLVDNKDSKNIEHVFGLGDITEGDHDWEWYASKTAISKLDGVIPYSLVRGNHDTSPNLNKTFANNVYMDQFDGFYKENDINTSYKLFKVGQIDYLFITMNYGPFDDEINWVCDVIEKYPNHRVIISTHAYLYNDGQRIDSVCGVRPKTSNDDDYKFGHVNSKDSDYNNGNDLWDKLVSKYANIQLVLSGHVSTDNVVTTQVKGIHGNTVTQMLIDPQTMDQQDSEGLGMVCMLYFNEDGTQVQVEYYSTVKEQYLLVENQYNLDMSGVGSSAHNYVYGSNSVFHWVECEGCGEKDLSVQSKHTYDNDCDAECECGYTRTASEHIYIDSADENNHYKACSLCGSKDEKTVKPHVYDGACDSTCNSCSYERNANHKYNVSIYDKAEHWMECSVCGKVKESSISTHTFTNGCDKDCNECDYTRSTSHNYELKNDGVNYWKECSECGDKVRVEAPEKGCNGSLNISVLAVVILFGAVTTLKRKKDE